MTLSKCLPIALASYVLGAASVVAIHCMQPPVHAAESPQLHVRLHRFKLQSDKLATFQQWVDFEHSHHAETIATLEREKMYAEAIFRDPKDDPATIYWLEIRGKDGASESTSPHAVDKIYDEFMKQTLVPHSRLTMEPEYVLMPGFIRKAIVEHNLNAPIPGQK